LTKAFERKEKESKQQLENKAEALAKRKVAEELSEIEDSYQKKLGDQSLHIRELSEKLCDAQTKAQELEAKLNQGSAQVQGIISEDDLFQYLHKHMPTDRCKVEKWGQGRKGTDVIIHVQGNSQRAGSIIIENKSGK
jgi:hypothetical protein